MGRMNLDRDPSAMANAAAEEVRALNHRTLNPADAFQEPSDLYDVANGLKLILERLPQALQQLSKGLNRYDDADVLRMDDGSNPAVGAARALAALQSAQGQAQLLYATLGAATSTLSKMAFNAAGVAQWADAEDVADVEV
jgi:hypothetical protein